MDDKCTVIFGMEGLEEVRKAIYRGANALKKALLSVVYHFPESEATSKEMHYIKYSKKQRIRKKYYNRALKRALQKARED